MKKCYIFMALVVIALTVSCASMQKIKPEEGIYSETVQVPRMNAEDLFKTVNLWLTNRFAEQQQAYQSGGLLLFDEPLQTVSLADGTPALGTLVIPPSIVVSSNEGQGLISGEYTYVYREVIIKNSAEILRCISASFSIEVKDDEYTITFSSPYFRRHGSFNRDNMKIGKPITVVLSARDGTLSDGFYNIYLEPTRAEWEALAAELKNFVVGG
ncbi:MAG: hypothetical protein LBH75_04720 [Treponema sp.]|nr:hypothetical protein [Treponema sp.]